MSITLSDIAKAKRPEDLFVENDLKKQYHQLVKLAHPDNGGNDIVFQNLIRLYNLAISKSSAGTWGTVDLIHSQFSDDLGPAYKIGSHIYLTGNLDTLTLSLQHHQKVKAINDLTRYCDYHSELQKCLITNTTTTVLALDFPLKAYKIDSNLIARRFPDGLPTEHLAWIGSRLFEFAALLEHHHLTHCGINPSNIFIIPENHGIYVTNFYHFGSNGSKLTTISKTYKEWYPGSTFVKKTRESYIDIELAKRTLKSIIKVPIDPKLTKFLNTFHTSAKDTFFEYRELLNELYGKPVFHKLEL